MVSNQRAAIVGQRLSITSERFRQPHAEIDDWAVVPAGLPRSAGPQRTGNPTARRIARHYTPPCYTGNMELDVCGYYDDWYRPDVAQLVLDTVASVADWELEVVIAAQAIYASNFLNLN